MKTGTQAGTQVGRQAGSPIVVILDDSSDVGLFERWAEVNHAIAYDAVDAMDAAQHLSDFTTDGIPDIITIPRQTGENVSSITDLLTRFLGPDSHLSVYEYSKERVDRSQLISLEEIDWWFHSKHSARFDRASEH